MYMENNFPSAGSFYHYQKLKMVSGSSQCSSCLKFLTECVYRRGGVVSEQSVKLRQRCDGANTGVNGIRAVRLNLNVPLHFISHLFEL